MKRILGIDFGDVRTGIAVSDAEHFLASGLVTLTAPSLGALIEKIKSIAIEKDVEKIVLGHPINMNGTLGERSEKIKRFAARLESELALPVLLFDERCSTMAAHQFLNATDTRGKKRKEVVDTLSAQIILQNYLDAQKQTSH